jgi:hypothetical protein
MFKSGGKGEFEVRILIGTTGDQKTKKKANKMPPKQMTKGVGKDEKAEDDPAAKKKAEGLIEARKHDEINLILVPILMGMTIYAILANKV